MAMSLLAAFDEDQSFFRPGLGLLSELVELPNSSAVRDDNLVLTEVGTLRKVIAIWPGLAKD